MPDIDSSQPNLSTASEDEKARYYSTYFNIPLVHLKDKDISLEIYSKIPFDVSKAFGILAYEFDETKTPPILKIAVGDPARLQKKAPAILSELKKEKGLNFELAVTTKSDFDFALNKYSIKLAGKDKVVKVEAKNETPAAPKPEPLVSRQPQGGYPMVDLREQGIPYQTIIKFPEEVAIRYKMVVFESPAENKIKVAAVDPDNPKVKEILNFVKERNKLEIELYETSAQSLEFALRGYRNIQKVPERVMPTVQPAAVPPVQPPPVTTASPQGVMRKPPQFEEEKPAEAEKPPQVEKPKEETQKITGEEKTPEVKIEEISSAEVRKEIEEKGQTAVKTEAIAEEGEKDLDKILPQGINSTLELESAIKSGFIPKTLAAIVCYAVMEGASDIHIESDGKIMKLRYRIDGLLRDILHLPMEISAPVVSRVKILSKLKIDETRIPQDGRFEVKVKGRDIDLRVSTLPTVHGEKAVMRILDKSSQVLSIEQLGLMGNGLKVMENNIAKPYGIILSTGPTGSGKTTTLYAILSKINKPEINVVTLEDPVEYEIPNVNQCQIKPKIGFGFAEGLRSILRQDPDIIMVGEIRDQETASMATHAALTGHLVLTTLHTNDTASALPRLINMGVEPFLITSAINCIMAQRLVRKICEKCKEELKVPDAVRNAFKEEIIKSHNKELMAYKDKELKFYRGKGCSNCLGGYKGRIGLFEIMEMSDKIEELAVSRSPATVIKEQAMKDGMLTMKEDGIIKVLKGITTIDEILRVTTE